MSEVIFHHYPQSPVAEKVRVGMGIKGLSWRSVQIPRIPPKPDLMPLTGGYRRTPVMQIGADIYCDSQCILRELQRRYPEPTFFPGGADGLAWSVSRWTDGDFFLAVIKLVLGSAADQLPGDFAADRGRLYLGPDWNYDAVAAELPHVVAQVRAQFGWVEQRLAATGRAFLLGDQPALPDVLVYYLAWFLRGRWAGGPDLLAEFPLLEAWENRVRELGHGTATDLSSADAVEIARAATTDTPEIADANDAQGLAPGMTVGVEPADDGGDPVVTGKIRYLDAEKIAHLHQEDRVGEVCIHFPRVGYRITPA